MSITTSQLFKDIMNGRVYKSRIEVSVSNGTRTILLADKDIVKDSLSANWRSANNKSFSFGTCYAASLSFSAMQGIETQLEGEYLTITPTLYYDLGNDTEQAIPLGVFICDEPTLYIHTTAYDCYDAMLLFDEEIPTRFTGTPYNLLTFICARCGVPFGLTSQQVGAFPNSTYTFTIDPEEVRTYRDALAYISTMLGAYCQIDRQGRLVVRRFHTTPDGVLNRTRRINTGFGGYKTSFAGVKCRFLANQNYEPYEYLARSEGIVVDLGDIPIVENTPAAKNAMLQNIYTSQLADLEYYPCEITMAGDPSIEAGDMLTTKDRSGYDRNILLTSVTFQWRGESEIVSEGANPKITAVTTAEKRQQKQTEQAKDASTVVTATYVNADTISVGSTEDVAISTLRFNTSKDLTAIFGAEIPVYSSGDGYCVITYSDSGIDGDVVRARVHEGYNLITLVNHLYYDASRIVMLQLRAETEALTAGGAAPTLQIAQDTIRTYIFAQGLIAEAPWDGIISIVESIEAVAAVMRLQGLTESVSVTITSDDQSAFTAVLEAITTDMQTQSINDTMDVTFEYGDQIWRCGMGNRAGISRVFAPWTT